MRVGSLVNSGYLCYAVSIYVMRVGSLVCRDDVRYKPRISSM